MLPQLRPKIETQHLLTWAICGFRLKSRASNALESKKFSRLHSRTPSRRIAARVLISESDWFALWSAGMILHRVSQAAHSRQRSSAMAIPQGLGCCIHGKMFTGINFFSINIAQNKSTNTEFYRSDWLAKKMSETACPLSAKRTSAESEIIVALLTLMGDFDAKLSIFVLLHYLSRSFCWCQIVVAVKIVDITQYRKCTEIRLYFHPSFIRAIFRMNNFTKRRR